MKLQNTTTFKSWICKYFPNTTMEFWVCTIWKFERYPCLSFMVLLLPPKGFSPKKKCQGVRKGGGQTDFPFFFKKSPFMYGLYCSWNLVESKIAILKSCKVGDKILFSLFYKNNQPWTIYFPFWPSKFIMRWL